MKRGEGERKKKKTIKISGRSEETHCISKSKCFSAGLKIEVHRLEPNSRISKRRFSADICGLWKCNIECSVIADISDGKPKKSCYVALGVKLYVACK